MIKQTLFETNWMDRVKQVFAPPPPQQQTQVLQNRSSDYKVPVLLASNDKVVPITSGQEKARQLSHGEKVIIYEKSMDYLRSRKFQDHQYIARFGKTSDDRTISDVYFTFGFKKASTECNYNVDAMSNPICYCLLAYKLEDYVACAKKLQQPCVYVLDPYNVLILPREHMHTRWGNDEVYKTFMELAGDKAR